MATTIGARGTPLAILIVLACCAELSSAAVCFKKDTCLKVCHRSEWIRKECERCYPGIVCDSGDSTARRQLVKARQSVDQTTLAPTRDTTTDFITANDITTVADPDITTPTDASGTTDDGSSDPNDPPSDPTDPPAPNDPASARQSGDGCVDADGVYHELYSTWFDAYQCNLFVCSQDGISQIELATMCKPPPTDLGACITHMVPGECCPRYNCTLSNPVNLECRDPISNEVHPHGTNWVDDPIHPCVTYVCINGVPTVVSDLRPLCPLPPSHACIAYRDPGQCCNSFNCSIIQGEYNCTDPLTGIEHEDHTFWYDDTDNPCNKYLCNNGTIEHLFNKSRDCDEVSHLCTPVKWKGECCPIGNNCSCEYAGSIYNHGATFPDSVEHPCKRLRCDNGTLVTEHETACADLDCTDTEWPPGQCCYVCAGCTHLGQDRPEGSVWPNSLERPCDFFTCRDGEVFPINSTQCDPPPNDSCEPWHSFGRCCPKWDCDQNPTDRPCNYQGSIFQDGATWPENALRPCIYFGCRNGTVYIARTEPPCPPSPGPHCLARQVPYQCCPAYDCVNITCAYKNQTFLEGAIWPDNPLHPCKWFICQRTGVTLFNSTSCEPVSAETCGGQTPIVLPGECCKQCPDGPGGDNSMCMDPSGGIHDEGCIYFNDIAQCVLVECVNNTEVVVLDLSENCAPPPHPSCTAEINPLECCPTYTCPPAPCTDYLGNPRAEGEIYYKDEKECVLVQCVNGTEVELVDLTESCPQPPADANCTVTPQDDECCPRIICPNFCIYNGQFYPVGVQWWDDVEKRCTRYECRRFGVIAVVSTELPCRNPPRGCVGQTASPQCCPFKYTCMYDLEGNLIPMN